MSKVIQPKLVNDYSSVIDVPISGISSSQNSIPDKLTGNFDKYSFGNILIPKDIIKNRINHLAKEVSKYYLDHTIYRITPVLLMKGAMNFGKDFFEQLDSSIEQDSDYMCISSYGSSLKSSGKIHILQDLTTDVKDKHVLLIDDILDTGNTLKFAIDYLKSKGAKSVNTIVLLNKLGIDKKCPVDHICFNIPDVFVVGYGMDYDNRFRNIPFVFYIK